MHSTARLRVLLADDHHALALAVEEPERRARERGAHATLGKVVDPDRLVATLREVCGRAFGPVALPPPGGLGGLAGDELERVWGLLLGVAAWHHGRQSRAQSFCPPA